MTSFFRNNKIILWFVFTFFSVLTLYLTLRTNFFIPWDDAAITFRYAQNIKNGFGFVYNKGEFFQGTTTPLFTLILALGNYFSSDIFSISKVISFFSWFLIIYLVHIFSSSSRKNLLIGIVTLAVLVIQGDILFIMSSGMETLFYTALIYLSFYGLWKEKYNYALMTSAFAVLTRFDGLFIYGLVIAIVIYKKSLTKYKNILVLSFAVIALWFLFAQWYFGSMIPLSFTSKMTHEKTNTFLWPFLFFIQGEFGVLLIFFLFKVWDGFKKNKIYILAPLLWALSYLFAFSFSQLDYQIWYLIPLYPYFVYVAIEGVFLFSSYLRKPAKILISLFAIFLFVSTIVHGVEKTRIWNIYYKTIEIERFEVARWLSLHTDPSETVFTSAIGIIGLYSGNIMIDQSKLISLPSTVAIASTSPLATYYISYEHPLPEVLTNEYRVVKKMKSYTIYKKI